MARNLSVELASRGHSVSVATLWHDGQPSYELVDGVDSSPDPQPVRATAVRFRRAVASLRASVPRPGGGGSAQVSRDKRASGRRPRSQLARPLVPADQAIERRRARHEPSRLQPRLLEQAVSPRAANCAPGLGRQSASSAPRSTTDR